jgi:hypothetical protein
LMIKLHSKTTCPSFYVSFIDGLELQINVLPTFIGTFILHHFKYFD